MDLNEKEMARLFFANQVKSSIKDVRNVFFQIIDSLRTDDLDNIDQLTALLQDKDLSLKFSLFGENKTKAIRKSILDTTNGMERNLLEYIENFDIDFKADVELRGLFKK